MKTASTTAEAEAVIEFDEALDLVFTDIGLGEDLEGGISVGKFVETMRSGTPVLYTSGRALTDGMKSLFAAPAAFLPKPYTLQELNEAVETLLKSAGGQGSNKDFD